MQHKKRLRYYSEEKEVNTFWRMMKKMLPRDGRNYAEFATAQKATGLSESRPGSKNLPCKGKGDRALQTFCFLLSFLNFWHRPAVILLYIKYWVWTSKAFLVFFRGEVLSFHWKLHERATCSYSVFRGSAVFVDDCFCSAVCWVNVRGKVFCPWMKEMK